MPSKPIIPRVCLRCGSQFLGRATEINRGGAIYCNRECLYAAQRGQARKTLTTYHLFLNMLHGIPDGDACLIWPFARHRQGYGETQHDGKVWLVHRLAWETVNGPIPDDLDILHHCDNPPCFRPSHLFPGNQLDNVHDMISKGRGGKLTDDKVREIRQRFQNGETYSQLLPDYPVSRANLWAIINRKTWKHV